MSARNFVVVFLVIFVSMFTFFVSEGLASDDVAGLAVNQAEDAIVSAYGAVLEAEQAGANVSSLIVQLNEAGEFLTKAYVAYRLGDFNETVLLAGRCSEIGESAKNRAEELRIEAYRSRVTESWLTVTGSLVSVFVFVFGGFWGWGFFKRRYYRRVLTKKPEVAKIES